MALIMMGGASSQAQTAPLCDTKIIELTIGDYQEFQKETAPDQDEDDSTLDLTAIKMDWTSQQSKDFLQWKNDSSSEYSYRFLDPYEFTLCRIDRILTQWPQWVCKDGELLLDPTVNGDVGGLSLYQIVNTPPSSSRTDGVTDSSDHSAQPDAPSSTSDNQPASNNNSWFTTRNMVIAGGIILCLLLGVAGALSYGATVGVAAGSVDAATFVAGSGEAATVVAKSELAEVVTPSVLKTP